MPDAGAFRLCAGLFGKRDDGQAADSPTQRKRLLDERPVKPQGHPLWAQILLMASASSAVGRGARTTVAVKNRGAVVAVISISTVVTAAYTASAVAAIVAGTCAATFKVGRGPDSATSATGVIALSAAAIGVHRPIAATSPVGCQLRVQVNQTGNFILESPDLAHHPRRMVETFFHGPPTAIGRSEAFTNQCVKECTYMNTRILRHAVSMGM
jgi:hypothetical protein